MAEYVDIVIGGQTLKYCQLDDGSLVPVNVGLSLDGGTLVRLSNEAIAQLQDVTLPETYPLPSSQVSDLKIVQVSNFPSGFAISNFPASFQVSNLPATFPLSPAQEAIVAAIRDRVQGFTQGAGAPDGNTLRVAQARRSPSAFTVSSVAVSTTAGTVVAANTSRLTLDIFNRGSGDVFLAWGANNPSSTLYSLRLSEGDFFQLDLNEAVREVRAICAAGTSATLNVTEGV